MAGFALDILHQPDAGFFGGQSGNFLQTRLLIRHEFLQFFFFFLDKTFLLDHLLFQIDQFALFQSERFDFFLQAFFLGLQTSFVFFQLPLPVLGVLLHFLL